MQAPVAPWPLSPAKVSRSGLEAQQKEPSAAVTVPSWNARLLSVKKAWLGYGAFLLLVFSGEAQSGCAGQECTEMGCIDGYEVTIRRADGTAPTEPVAVEYGEEHVVCPPVSVDGERYVACSIAVGLSLRDQVTCTETQDDDSQSQSCTPTGDYELSLTIQGLPVSVRVTLNGDDTVIHERTFTPDYRSFQPNGEGCEPTCRQASDVWSLP